MTGAAAADGAAARAVARAAPVRFGVATAPDDVVAVFRLRASVALAEAWVAPEALPGGLERDGEDAGAIHVAGWIGSGVVATGRLVARRADRALPTEAAFAVRAPAEAVDVGRVCVAPGYRDFGHRVFWGLLGRLWIEMRARGHATALSAVTGRLADAYTRWGFEVTPLGLPRPYWGRSRIPVLIAPTARVGATRPLPAAPGAGVSPGGGG